MLTFILQVNLLICTLIQCLFWGFIYSKLRASDSEETIKNQSLPISIIIVVHEWSNALQVNFKRIADQIYSDFEIIIVNDGPIKGLAELILEFQQDSNSRFVYIEHNKSSLGKKLALHEGIQRAKYDWVLLTDADCSPSSQYWIQKMVENINPSTEIVLGVSPYKTKGTWVHGFIQFETLLNTSQYLGMANSKFPYMGVGRNLLYQKRIFNIQESIPSHPSGDDDILINNKSNRINTIVSIDPSSFVYTEPKATLSQYFQQRRRHYSSAQYYQFKDQMFLLLHFFSYFSIFALSIYLLFHHSIVFPIFCIISYLFISSYFLIRNAKLLKEKINVLYIPFFHLLYLLFLVAQAPFLFIPKRDW